MAADGIPLTMAQSHRVAGAQKITDQKHIDSATKQERKHQAAGRIRFLGRRVHRAIVKSHQWMRSKGLPHSEAAAAVQLVK